MINPWQTRKSRKSAEIWGQICRFSSHWGRLGLMEIVVNETEMQGKVAIATRGHTKIDYVSKGTLTEI